MLRRRPLRLALGFALTAMLAACVDDQPTQPLTDDDEGPLETDMSASLGPAPRGLDFELARISREVPGFGGMFLDRAGTLHVHVRRDREAVAASRDEMMTRLRPTMPAFGRAGVAPANVEFHEAEYDFARLQQYRERMRGIFNVDGVVYIDVDEVSNRVRVGVLEGTPRARIEQALSRFDVPLEAVTITSTPAIQRLRGETLRDLVRPTGGGLQLVWEYPGVGFFLCTLGFNVDLRDRGRSQPYFLTNSHCTGDQGVVTGTEYFQPEPPDANGKRNLLGLLRQRLIGEEVLDPPFFTDPCYEGYICRWSDAAMVRYRRTIPVRFGSIYRTESVGTTTAGSIDLPRGVRFFSIKKERRFPLVGDIVDKVGRTTGWTRGEVFATCVDVLVSGTNQVMLCQDLVEGISGGGDSGSPVFQQDGRSRNVTLLGLLWGGSEGVWAFSSLENIRFELGRFRTH